MPGFEWAWSGPALAIGGVVVLVAGGLITWGVLYLEEQNRRDARATRLQSDLTAALRRDPALTDLSILPVVQVPRAGPISVDLAGDVPSAATHDRLITAIEHELLRHPTDARIIDRLQIKTAA